MTSKKKKELSEEEYFSESLALGKLPPQAKDVEEAVLGALLIDNTRLHLVVHKLDANMFYVTAHQHIYTCIKRLYTKDKPVDLLTVTEELRKDEKLDVVGGAYYIAKLTNRVTSSANIDFHTHIVIQKYMQREIIKIANNGTDKAFKADADPFELLNELGKELLDIQMRSVKRGMRSTDDMLLSTIKKIESYNPEQVVSGVPTGYTNLDNITLGWQPGDLIILAARPSMGKSALAFGMFKNAALDYQKHGLFASLEMSGEQLLQRAISSESGVEQEKIKKGDLTPEDWVKINEATNKLSTKHIHIMDEPGLTVGRLKAQAVALKLDGELDFIIVDYLQLLQPDNMKANRDVQIGQISRDLKRLAMELEIPVIALAQLSREVEKRPDKKPMLSDLRESGNIEQDADLVGFLMRPEYYDSHKPFNYGGEDRKPYGLAYFEFAKHRNGSIGASLLYFDKKTVSFRDYGNYGKGNE